MSHKIPKEYHEEIIEYAREHIGRLHRRLLRSAHGDRALADDLVQDVLIIASLNWAALRKLDADKRTDLLNLIAGRRAIDTFRKNNTARTYQSKMQPFFQQPEADPCRQAVTAAALERFVEVIESLPRQQARAATLKWRFGCKNVEIADILGISPSAVTQLVTKAKSTLKRELHPYLYFESSELEGGA